MGLFGKGASAEDKAAYRAARQELDRVCTESREERSPVPPRGGPR
jgi:hypothetical protein